jgi:hypothetical protein
MPLPSDIEAWITEHNPCPEGAERLAEHASMSAAWKASNHGPYLLYILKREGKVTADVSRVAKIHQRFVKIAGRRARDSHPNAAERLQSLDSDYEAVLSRYARAIKDVAPNPFS